VSICLDVPPGAEVVTMPDGLQLVCRNVAEATATWREVFLHRAYERVVSGLSPGDCVLDAGANIGLATLYFRSVEPRLVVHAFEPAHYTFDVLAANVRPRHPDVGLHRTALGDRRGSATFTYYPNSSCQSGLYGDPADDDRLTRNFLRNSGIEDELHEELLEGLHDPVLETVAVSTLSHELERLGLTEVALLKLDVERAEEDVLSGITDRDWTRFARIVIEVHDIDGRLARLTRMLSDRGFACETWQEPLLRDSGLHTLLATRPTAGH
jgi:31-O-methyltransferase